MRRELSRFQDRLAAELDAQIEAIARTAESAGTVVLDQSSVGRVSRMDAMQQQAMARGLQQRLVLRKRKLEAALARVESGNYGTCCQCQADMNVERLEVDPAALFCSDCASEREAGID